MKKSSFLLIVIAIVLFSCKDSFNDGKVVGSGNQEVHHKWTFIVYMAADNDLEASAIADFNELEAVNFAGSPVSVLVLFDRATGYDATNGDWTDTRLFEVTTDPSGNNSTIVSKRLDCPGLGLSATANTELNMADPLILSRLIDFAKSEYAADNYGLLIWGHGTGWRGGGDVEESVPEPLKAVAIDGATYMSLPSFGGAIAGKGLKVVGFDTCFGAELEVAYQIRNSAEFLVGSAGIIPSTGWNYQSLFTSFLSATDPTASAFCDYAISQFSAQYAGTNNTTISKIALQNINTLFTAFENFSAALADCVDSTATKNIIRTPILNEQIDVYRFAPPAELYIDLYSFTDKMKSASVRDSLTTNSTKRGTIDTTGATLQSALAAAIPASWSKQYGTSRRQIGVFFIGIAGVGSPDATHPDGYTKGTIEPHCAFVEASAHWVPNVTPSPTSLLDKLFYSGY